MALLTCSLWPLLAEEPEIPGESAQLNSIRNHGGRVYHDLPLQRCLPEQWGLTEPGALLTQIV